MDLNNDGGLELAEVEDGIRIVLGLSRFMNKTLIKKAFKLAGALKNESDGKRSARRVSLRSMSIVPKHFRAFFVVLRYLFELSKIFESLAGEGDKIVLKEFQHSVANLRRFKCKDIERIEKNPEKYFKEIDKYSKGAIDLEMFLDWALQPFQELEHDEDDKDDTVLNLVRSITDGTYGKDENTPSGGAAPPPKPGRPKR